VKANKPLGESFAGASSAREMESTTGPAEGAAGAGRVDEADTPDVARAGAVREADSPDLAPAGPVREPGPADLAPFASALNSGAIHLLRSLAAVDRRSGLPRARLSALSVLVFGGSRTLGELAAAEGVAGPTMTRIVDGLIAEHLAERLPHPTDGRAVLIAATAAGETLMRGAQRRRIDALAAAIAGLPPDQWLILAAAGPLLDELAAAVRGLP
jgi:DNA-binding MarR family transcriptional regulator